MNPRKLKKNNPKFKSQLYYKRTNPPNNNPAPNLKRKPKKLV